MPSTTDRPLVLDDPAVPVDALLGAGAVEVVGAAFAGVDAEVLSTRPTGTTYHRGRSLTVRHDVRVRWPDGRRTTEPVVLGAGRRVPPGALVVSDGRDEIVVFREPADPWLPGLAAALDPARIGPVLHGLGFPEVELRCRSRAYRPGRRAVVEVTGAGVRAFVKVVRPSAAEGLHRRHEALSGSVPVPASLGWSPEHGVVVLEALGGRTVRQVLATTGPLPSPGALVGLLDALPPPEPGSPVREGWRVAEMAAHIGAVAPDLAPRTGALAEGLLPFEQDARATPVVPVHGDLHDAQLLVDGGRIVGVLDVDTFGPGHRIDELATYLGHLVVLATARPAQRQRIESHARKVLAGADRVADPALLRAGVAAVVLGLATGSFRVLEPRWHAHTAARVALAEQWLDSALGQRT